MENPNLNYIDQLSGDNDVFKQKIIGILQRELSKEVEEYFSNLKSGDLLQAVQMVHKLKHKISILGMEKSYYIASEFEENLKNNVLVLQDDFETILETMADFVKQL